MIKGQTAEPFLGERPLNSIRTYFNLVLKTAFLLTVLAGVYLGALVLSHYLVDDQVIFDSIADDIAQNGVFFKDDKDRIFTPSPLGGRNMRAFMADCRILTIGLTKSGDGLEDAFRDSVANHSSKRCPRIILDYFSADHPEQESHTYARYWHGYAVFTRPLLAKFGFTGLRNMFVGGIFLAFLIFIFVIYRAQGPLFAAAFLLPVPMFSMSFFLSTVSFNMMFLVGLVAFIALLPLLRRSHKDTSLFLAFAVIGSFTSFADRLIDPLFTLCIPLIGVIAIYMKNDARFQQLRSSMFLLTGVSAFWLFGYAYNWILKFALSAAVMGPREWQRVVNKAMRRTSSDTNIGDIERIDGLLLNIHRIDVPFIITLLVLMMAVAFSFRRMTPQHHCLILVGLFPIAWMLVFANHSYVHNHFVHYLLYITISCFLSVAALLWAPVFAKYNPVKRIKLVH